MFADIDIFRMSSAMASHAGRRQALAAQNMANVDTPGYRGQRLPGFPEVFESNAGGHAPRATRSGHLMSVTDGIGTVRVDVQRDAPAPDGNTVSAEAELLESINAEREHKRALAVYKSALNILHATVRAR